MAFKKYSFYNKGNKIGLVESEKGSASGTLAVAHCTLGGYTTKDTCEAAGGQWIPSSSGFSIDQEEKYLSPKSDVDKGLEIEYSYAPTYHVKQGSSVGHVYGTSYYNASGWGSDGEHLLIFHSKTGSHGPPDISSSYTADTYVYIEGTGRWSGLHKVKSASSSGILTLHTKCNIYSAHLQNITATIIADPSTNYILNFLAGIGSIDELTTFTKSIPTWGSGPNYFFLAHSGDNKNKGLFSVEPGVGEDYQYLSFKIIDKYGVNQTSGLHQDPVAADLAAESDVTDYDIYKAFQEDIKIFLNVESMIDESFELDLTDYQAQAVVYYLKAKMAEDLMAAKGREYFMNLFYKQIEKSASSKKPGPRIIQGFWGMK